MSLPKCQMVRIIFEAGNELQPWQYRRLGIWLDILDIPNSRNGGFSRCSAVRKLPGNGRAKSAVAHVGLMPWDSITA